MRMLRPGHVDELRRWVCTELEEYDPVASTDMLRNGITLKLRRGDTVKRFEYVPPRGVSVESVVEDVKRWVSRCRRAMQPKPGRIRRRRQLR